MASGPTERSLKECRRRGWEPAVVEKWNPVVKRRHDLYGFLDIVVMDDQSGLLGIQATSQSNASAREAKIAEEPMAHLWLLRGLRIEVWGWRKLKKPVNRRYWRVRITRASLTVGGSIVWEEVEVE